MLNRIIALVMSYVISITGFMYSSVNGLIDSVSELVFGLPYSAEAIKSDFFGSITEKDIENLDSENGFVNNKIAVFVNPKTSFKDKLTFFNTSGGKLVGWSTPTDLYVIEYGKMSYDAVTARCERLMLNDAVELAIPVTASRFTPDGTPADDFDYSDIYSEWNELNPDGRNWWLEAIDARQAWDYSDYFSRINIGLVDAGFDLDHPDLEGKISFPSDKFANRNRQDSHGCHVAGIIGAKHNGSGIAGICDNSNLICVDWTPDLLQFWITDIAVYFGFSSVVEAGAKVVNFSLGSSSSKAENDSSLIEKIITPAAYSYMMGSLLAKGYDFIVVQSAGNGDMDGNPINAENNGSFSTINRKNVFTGSNNIPADEILDRIILVASAGNKGNGKYVQSDFSNVGSSVEISAPGENVYSCSIEGGYEYLSGTSMSAPIVTAVASLVWSVNPGFSGADVKEIVCTATDSVAVINTSVPYIYDDLELMDYPVVNAKLAVEEAIRRTDSSIGTVNGKINADAAEIVFDGVSHTVFSDGTYSFVAQSGSGNADVFDSDGIKIGSFMMTVEAGKTVEAGEYTPGQGIPATPSDVF